MRWRSVDVGVRTLAFPRHPAQSSVAEKARKPLRALVEVHHLRMPLQRPREILQSSSSTLALVRSGAICIFTTPVLSLRCLRRLRLQRSLRGALLGIRIKLERMRMKMRLIMGRHSQARRSCSRLDAVSSVFLRVARSVPDRAAGLRAGNHRAGACFSTCREVESEDRGAL